MTRRQWTWSAFAACAACGAALLAWLTAAMLALEHAEGRARAHAEHEIAIGAALWQMDAWLLTVLTPEAQRPFADYQAFNRLDDAYTNSFSKLGPGEVVAPSPLLGFRSPYVRLHFQVDADGRITSPQVPEGNALDVTQSQEKGLQFDAQRTLLDELRRVLSPRVLADYCAIGCAALPKVELPADVAAPVLDQGWNSNYAQRAQVATQARRQNLTIAAGGGDARAPADNGESSQLVPLWLDGGKDGERLAFVRRLMVSGRRVYQGFLADWDELRHGMVAQIRDLELAKSARLRRVDRPDASTQPHLLTVVPALLEVTPPAGPQPTWSKARTLLVVAWLALLATALVAALTLRAALAFGDRRARFASAVTHELRTPLTTFRMYSEMLATGMVADPARRQQYLETLRSESDRLARLVENVLGYARIEDGRFTARIERLSLAELASRVHGVLARRAADARVELAVEVLDGATVLDVDVDAVAQILFNLVDNACKYGQPPLQLTARTSGGLVRLSVRDFGAGVPAAYRERVFAAFDRGARRAGDNETPGIGLGLSLARGLARDLGGDLRLADAEPGACFVLTLPTRGTHRGRAGEA